MTQERIFVPLPSDLKRAAKVKAAQEHVTLAAVIRDLLGRWLRGELSAPDPGRTKSAQ